MKKKLSKMSLDELWQLFPIFWTEHQVQWSSWYIEEVELLHRILPQDYIARISHIGSTVINAIWAKPIVDILVEAPTTHNINHVKKILINNGYSCMSESEKRMSFNKDYTEEGFAEKVYHLHLRMEGDNDELYFTDYLNENALEAKQYEKLKLSLRKKILKGVMLKGCFAGLLKDTEKMKDLRLV